MAASDKTMPISEAHMEDGPLKEPIPNLKTGRDGLPLVPQPSDHKDDPLVGLLSRVQEPQISRDALGC